MNYVLKQTTIQASATMIWSSFKMSACLFSLHSIILRRLSTLPDIVFSVLYLWAYKLQTVELFQEKFLFRTLFSLCTGNVYFYGKCMHASRAIPVSALDDININTLTYSRSAASLGDFAQYKRSGMLFILLNTVVYQ